MIDFTIPPELDQLRTRVGQFILDEVLPVEEDVTDEQSLEDALEPLRKKARDAGLWTPHLPPEWGGLGVGPLGMALISQECGVSGLASLAINAMAPDEGNMHLLLHAGTDVQKEKYLKPLAAAQVRSCFAMTERDVSGSDPTALRARAVRDGAEWVIDGEKWFISGADGAAFAIVVALTDPDNENRYLRHTLLLVDEDNPGWNVIRQIPVMGTHGPGGHCEVKLEGCRVPVDAVLGDPGMGLALAQTRLGPARLAHAMRWIGVAQRALDMAATRALERSTFGKPLADHQAVQWWLADSAIQLYAARLMVLHAAYKIENDLDFKQEVSFVKVFVSEALGDIVDRALQLHGSLGYSTDTPLEGMYRDARAARIYDGPSEVHRMVIARNLLKAAKAEGSTRSALGGLA
ncbi:MAG: acyl-CoA dehydrogenase family protein [Actinomycetota bacterium]